MSRVNLYSNGFAVPLPDYSLRAGDGVCDCVLWPLVGRASPHDLFRRAGTLALLRAIPHWPTRAIKVSRAGDGRGVQPLPAGGWLFLNGL